MSIVDRITLRTYSLPSYPTWFYFRTELPPSLEQVWTPQRTPDKFPSTSSDSRECSRRRTYHTQPDIVVAHIGIVPIAISRTAVTRIIVPGTAPQLNYACPNLQALH